MKIYLGFPVRRRWVSVGIEPADWWIGYYRGDSHHYVCPLPCIVIRWARTKECPTVGCAAERGHDDDCNVTALVGAAVSVGQEEPNA